MAPRAALVKQLTLLLALTMGCAHLPAIIRISAAAGRLICAASGCPCVPSNGGLMATQRPIAYDVYPDGGVRPVYQGTR